MSDRWPSRQLNTQNVLSLGWAVVERAGEELSRSYSCSFYRCLVIVCMAADKCIGMTAFAEKKKPEWSHE